LFIGGCEICIRALPCNKKGLVVVVGGGVAGKTGFFRRGTAALPLLVGFSQLRSSQ